MHCHSSSLLTGYRDRSSSPLTAQASCGFQPCLLRLALCIAGLLLFAVWGLGVLSFDPSLFPLRSFFMKVEGVCQAWFHLWYLVADDFHQHLGELDFEGLRFAKSVKTKVQQAPHELWRQKEKRFNGRKSFIQINSLTSLFMLHSCSRVFFILKCNSKVFSSTFICN